MSLLSSSGELFLINSEVETCEPLRLDERRFDPRVERTVFSITEKIAKDYKKRVRILKAIELYLVKLNKEELSSGR
ncbi:hypothetical protein FRX31_027369 [Thalictrum thalictroides]|uniref:Uncharacterized protein n=1 Tax=Thalictrum thalictroides TaxID=46969 RepID=A0A7J6VFQ3_THATH|nr:hypothetical protein FRX31_027369 [Thalictrum thalictroides]